MCKKCGYKAEVKPEALIRRLHDARIRSRIRRRWGTTANTWEHSANQRLNAEKYSNTAESNDIRFGPRSRLGRLRRYPTRPCMQTNTAASSQHRTAGLRPSAVRGACLRLNRTCSKLCYASSMMVADCSHCPTLFSQNLSKAVS